jgi:hypothetical protein
MLRKLSAALILCLMVALIALPLFAQTASPDPNAQVVVVGPVDLSQGDIRVNNYVIAPASAFQPSILHQGDVVVIVGTLLPDGITIQADSFDFFQPTEEVTPEPTAEVTSEPTVEVTTEPTAEVTSEPTVEVTTEPTSTAGCSQPNQPVAQRLADSFGVSYDEIMGWHCQGFGFGEIARAYLLADAAGDNASTYFAERQGGEGWGQIVKQAGVHPSALAPGQVIRPNHDATEESSANSHPGNGNGGGNGNGNGNGHGNGGGNGNGNGDGNGNGGGNGKGKGPP